MKIATTNLIKKEDKKERNPERLFQDPKKQISLHTKKINIKIT